MILEELVRGARANAVLGWASAAVAATVAVESFLTGAFLWGGLATVVVAVASLPAVVTGDPSEMPPWLLPFVAAVAVILRRVGIFPDVAGYVATGGAGPVGGLVGVVRDRLRSGEA